MIGYAWVSSTGQDLIAQRDGLAHLGDGLAHLGVDPDRVDDHGRTGYRARACDRRTIVLNAPQNRRSHETR